MSDQDLKAELERLRPENEALKQRGREGTGSIKVSEKGAVSVTDWEDFPSRSIKSNGKSSSPWQVKSKPSWLSTTASSRKRNNAASILGSVPGLQRRAYRLNPDE
jgi:hypothetical protein